MISSVSILRSAERSWGVHLRAFIASQIPLASRASPVLPA